jgi:sugar phosphate isomerase/epimerase
MTALEHLRAFARPLGVKLLLENLQNEVTEPKNLLEILSIGHFGDIGVCLDLGHAHIMNGVQATMEEVKPLIISSHIHDNHGDKDEHLWPGDGTIDWAETGERLQTSPKIAGGVLEIHYQLGHSPEEVSKRAMAVFEKLGL